ncbi:MAG TPA: 6,7-dimethyl-8-ribityllumazine synthase [Candidatus Acidoferrales bacterium]|nr:6,7-dimethyl-8-ribityllumazine synthase [Candidatus Acidoferrales bacterium]
MAKDSAENSTRKEEKAASNLHPKPITGELSAAGLHFGIVASRFNQFITDRLLAAALDALERSGATEKQIELVRVPGSLEIPIAAKKLAQTGRCDAIICIGCVIRGTTAHFDYVCNEVARGVQLTQLDTGVPMVFCVLTCDTLEQAIDRAGLKSGNKGFDAGLTAIEIANLSRKLAAKSTVRSTAHGRSRPRKSSPRRRH